MDKRSIRSPLGRARGLGSAKAGAEHWWLQRVTAVALVPLTLWLAASIIMFVGNDHAEVRAWLQTPVAAVLMVLLLIGLFYHMALGLQVIIEDYIHSKAKFVVAIAIRLSCLALAVAGIWATLRIGVDA